MRISEFKYHRPTTLAEACNLGQSLGDTTRFLAGGTELLVDLKKRRDTANHIVALRGIAGLKEISSDGTSLRIGGLATLEDIGRSPLVGDLFPSLNEAVLSVGSVHIRNQATIGGNFCAAVPCADTPPICIAGEGQVKVVGVGTERSMKAEDLFTGPRKTVLEPGEVLAEILIPSPPRNSGASFQRFSLRRGLSLPVASVAVRLTLAGEKIVDARVVLGAVAPTALRAKKAEALLVEEGKPSESLFVQAAQLASDESLPITDLRGTVEFRRDLIKVLAKRALMEATARAKGNK
jgi:carbon-monoxide dehydrogenase medium subunit